MSNPKAVFSQIDHFNENLISNIQGGVIICQFDPNSGASKAIYLSEGWTELTGYTMQELNDNFNGNPQALVYPEDAPRCNREYVEQTEKGNSYQLEYRCMHKNGSLIWLLDKGIITATEDGYNQNQSIITNITPIKENEEKLRMSEARFRVAINATHAAVFEFDLEQKRYIYLENAALIFRKSSQNVLAELHNARQHTSEMSMVDVFKLWYHAEDLPVLQHAFDQLIYGDGSNECEVRVRQPDGDYRWCKLHCATVEDTNGKPVRVVGHLMDIEEQHRRTDRLLLEAQSDALTGLYNKTAIRDLSQQILKSTPQLSHALLMLDIDNFKGVNDQLGHLFGDAVLMDVSAKLKRLFRRDGLVGRIGGDEFVILLSKDCTEEEAAKRAEEICSAFRHTYSGEKNDYKISCSVGAALSKADDSFDSLFHKADLALYKAKSLGKDQFVVYSTVLGNSLSHRAHRINQTDSEDSGGLKIKERIFELLYDSVDFSGSVNMILSLLGQILDTSRITIFENTDDNKFAQNIYEWRSDGTDLQTDDKMLPVEELKYYDNFNDEGIFACDDFSHFPENLRTDYERYNTKITFQVQIVEDNIVRGFMRYDCAIDSNRPSPEQEEIMIFAAKVTGTFIIKKRADESVKLYNQNKMEALDNMPSAIYVIDEAYRLQYVNNMTKDVYPNVQQGQKCHEVFMKSDKPCFNCPAQGCQNGLCSTEIYNPYSKMWMIANASPISWSGYDHMRLICCQVITQYKTQEKT